MGTQTRRFLFTGLGLAVVVGSWVLLAPRQVGGPVSYAIISGTSMEPKLHKGDLAIIREREGYGVGDVVAYESEELNRVVLHRIIAVEDGRFVLQGDNNDSPDTDQPSESNIQGKLWVQLAGVGGIVEFLARPLTASILVGLVTLALVGTSGRRRRGRRSQGSPAVTPRALVSIPRNTVVAASGALAIVFGALSGYAWTTPTTKSVDEKTPYQHSGTFEYSAPVPKGPVYEGTKLTTGDPVYLNLTNSVLFDFNYRFTTDAPHSVTGSGGLFATVSDTDGWSDTFRLAPNKPVGKDGTLELRGELNLGAIRSLTNRVEKATGVTRDVYSIAVRPTIEVTTTIDGQEIGESFSPTLAFSLTDLTFLPTPDAAGGDPYFPGQGGALDKKAEVPRSLSLGLWEPGVANARRIALLGLVLAALALGAAVVFLPSPTETPENSRIQARYGSRLVPVMSPPPSRSEAIEVASIEALIRLAEGYECMILHHSSSGIDSYFIDHDGHVYVYRTATDDAVAMLSASLAGHRSAEGSEDA